MPSKACLRSRAVLGREMADQFPTGQAANTAHLVQDLDIATVCLEWPTFHLSSLRHGRCIAFCNSAPEGLLEYGFLQNITLFSL